VTGGDQTDIGNEHPGHPRAHADKLPQEVRIGKVGASMADPVDSFIIQPDIHTQVDCQPPRQYRRKRP